jgi:hypothetical protein
VAWHARASYTPATRMHTRYLTLSFVCCCCVGLPTQKPAEGEKPKEGQADKNGDGVGGCGRARVCCCAPCVCARAVVCRARLCMCRRVCTCACVRLQARRWRAGSTRRATGASPSSARPRCATHSVSGCVWRHAHTHTCTCVVHARYTPPHPWKQRPPCRAVRGMRVVHPRPCTRPIDSPAVVHGPMMMHPQVGVRL